MSSVIYINPDRHPTATRAYAASSATSVLRSDCSGRLPQRPEVRVGSPHLKRKSEHLVYTRSDKYQHMCACMFVPGRKKKWNHLTTSGPVLSELSDCIRKCRRRTEPFRHKRNATVARRGLLHLSWLIGRLGGVGRCVVKMASEKLCKNTVKWRRWRSLESAFYQFCTCYGTCEKERIFIQKNWRNLTAAELGVKRSWICLRG